MTRTYLAVETPEGPATLSLNGEKVSVRVREIADLRKAITDVFGGMGPTSVVWGNDQWSKGWGNDQWSKGYTAGVLAAVTAFDTKMRALFEEVGG